jgi:D-alanyl-D-alanine carboxypeptidase
MPQTTATAGTLSRPERRRILQERLDRLIEVGAAGVQFRLADGDDLFLARAGVAQLDGTAPMPYDGRFRAACITKTFVSTVVLQLVTEGVVKLDEPVDTYLPGLLPDGRQVLVRNLLQHTSGLYNHADSFQRPGVRFLRDRYKHYDTIDLVSVATAKPLNFEPGTKFEYSNTNYLVLGMLIEKVTGKDYAAQIHERIVTPLGLSGTYVPDEDDPEIHGEHAHGYMMINGKSEDVTRMNPSEARSAGSIISTTPDLDRFLTALVTGKLLSGSAFAEMTHRVPSEWVTLPMSAGYGLGFMPLQTSCGLDLWGHGGGIPGYATFIGATLDGRKRVITSITLNIDPDDFAGTFEDAVVAALEAAADCLV